jgi:hypothetical protein
MAAITVTTHRARIRSDVQQWITSNAPIIGAEVERHFGRRLEPVTIVLTSPRGRSERYWQVVAAVAGGAQLDMRMRWFEWRHRRGSIGEVTVNPAGGALMLLDATDASMRRPDLAARVLAHELVHCDQHGRPGVRAGRIAAIRHNLGVEIDNAAADAVNKLVDQHENEAYRLEKRIAEVAQRQGLIP